MNQLYKRLIIVLIALLFLVQCGLLKKNEELQECASVIPADVLTKNSAFAAAANAARLAAVDQERQRLGTSPVTLDERLEYSLSISESSFPNAVPVFLDSASPQNGLPGLFSQFHGYEGYRTVYETEPGSNRYFIVDEVLGDGAGSASLSQWLPGLSNDGSMHSWHVTSDNRLVRAKVHPTFVNSQTITVCGCHGYEISSISSGVMAPPQYGIFMLPGNAVPTLHSGEMHIEYVDESIKINNVDDEGKACPTPVC